MGVVILVLGAIALFLVGCVVAPILAVCALLKWLVDTVWRWL